MHINPKHKGLFHKDVGVKEGEPIPMAKVIKALHSSDPKKRARANFARMAKRGWKPIKKAAA